MTDEQSQLPEQNNAAPAPQQEQQAPATQHQAASEPAPQQELPSAGRRPDYAAYSVQDTRDGKGFWNRVGAAWAHKDGQGFDVNLDSMPINGRVTLREQRDKRMQEYNEERAAQGEYLGPPTQSRGYER